MLPMRALNGARARASLPTTATSTIAWRATLRWTSSSTSTSTFQSPLELNERSALATAPLPKALVASSANSFARRRLSSSSSTPSPTSTTPTTPSTPTTTPEAPKPGDGAPRPRKSPTGLKLPRRTFTDTEVRSLEDYAYSVRLGDPSREMNKKLRAWLREKLGPFYRDDWCQQAGLRYVERERKERVASKRPQDSVVFDAKHALIPFQPQEKSLRDIVSRKQNVLAVAPRPVPSDAVFFCFQYRAFQYKVVKGDVLILDRVPFQVTDTFKVDEVLLVGSQGRTIVGRPTVPGASVVLQVEQQVLEKKLITMKKREKRYSQRTKGSRHHVSVVRVVEASLDEEVLKQSKEKFALVLSEKAKAESAQKDQGAVLEPEMEKQMEALFAELDKRVAPPSPPSASQQASGAGQASATGQAGAQGKKAGASNARA